MKIINIAATSLVVGASFFAGYVFGRDSIVNFSGDSHAVCVFGQACSGNSNNLYKVFNVIVDVSSYAFRCADKILRANLAYGILSGSVQLCKRIGSDVLSKIGHYTIVS